MPGRNARGLVLAALAVAALFCLLSSTAQAASPWDSLFSRGRVEADPQETYQLTEDKGPWLILAATFSGEGAEKQAHDLVLELRRRYKLPAYVHQMRFDLDKNVGGRGLDRFGQPIKWTYQGGNERSEIAVLVGDFSAIDDAEARDTLNEIKYARPDCLDLTKTKHTNQSFAALRYIQTSLLKSDNAKKKKGPMGHAFMVPNPLRKGLTSSKRVDPLVLKMNQGLRYSLLDCPGAYTVQVAHFVGKVVVNQSEIRQIENGEKDLTGTSLDDAAEKAHKLAEALRLKGYEAYEYHDRKASIVTVGSFNAVGTPRSDGKIEIDPAIHRIMETFKGTQPAPGGPLVPRMLVGIPLDVQPLPVEVPRQSIAASYSSPPRGLW
jgi:hypothetical protein